MKSDRELPLVRLRAMEPEDLDVLYKIENDRSMWGEGITNVPYSRYVLHDYIASSSSDIYADKQVRMMIENDEGTTIGTADIVDFNPKHRRAEIGMMLMREYRGKGYATAALEELCKYSSEVLNLNQLYAIVSVDNVKSLDMLRRMGFKESAPLTDWLYDGHKYSDAIVMQKKL